MDAKIAARNIVLSSFIVIVTVFASRMAHAQAPLEAFRLPEVVAVENRKFNRKSELLPHFGILPLDAFSKSLEFGIDYSYHFTNYFSFDVVQLSLTNNYDTELKKQLRDLDTQVEGVLKTIDWLATTGVSWSPLYSKSLLMNRSVVHSDTSLQGGAGVVSYNQGLLKAPLVYLGLSQRFGWTETLALRFTLRHHMVLPTQDQPLNHILMLDFGLSIQIGS